MARVLIVDDDSTALEIRKLLLETHGHIIDTASTPDDAREKFHASIPDAVILDLRLPDPEDGCSLIREFRAISQNVRIVVLAGLPSDLDGRSERELVNQIFAKPVRSELLLGSLI